MRDWHDSDVMTIAPFSVNTATLLLLPDIVRTVSDCVLVLIEVLDQSVPFVYHIVRSEPSKIIAMSDDKYGFVIYPFIE